jgi:hypothetical protein
MDDTTSIEELPLFIIAIKLDINALNGLLTTNKSFAGQLKTIIDSNFFWKRKLEDYIGMELSQELSVIPNDVVNKDRYFYDHYISITKIGVGSRTLVNTGKWFETKLALLLYPGIFDFTEADLHQEVGYHHLGSVIAYLSDRRIHPQRNNSRSLRTACMTGDVPMVEVLLKDRRSDPTINNNFIIRDLTIGLAIGPNTAAPNKNIIDIIMLLLKDGRADPSVDDNKLLMVAARNCHIDIIELLVKDPRVDVRAGNNLAIRLAKGCDKGVEVRAKAVKLLTEAAEKL